MVDQVKVVADEEASSEQSLRRNLTNRHIQLIAIGGAIGTGLFMGSGKTISLAGPSIIFVYMIIGFMLFFVMRAMGELLLSNLEYKSFSDFASDLLGPWAGYFTGWTYWFCWVVTGMADVVAITAYAQFWFPGLSDWVASLAVIVLLLSLNLATVKMFGEMEFWFAMIKIVAIVGLIVVGLVMVLTHFQSPTGVQASFTHLWNDGGWFPKGISGFFAGFQIAVFAFVGIELVGTTAAETKDPEKSLPRAINSIPVRIIMFYVFALIIIMSVTPWSSVVPSKSPFVELFVLVGLPAAASLINFVVLTSAASSANSGVFSTSRMLFGLAQEGVAPSAFAKLSKRAVPAKGLTFSCMCLLGGVVMLYVNPSVIGAFTMITTVSAILFMFVWTIILCSYLVYRKQRPHLHEKSIYKMPLGKLMCWVCMAFFVFVLVLLTLEDDTRQALIVIMSVTPWSSVVPTKSPFVELFVLVGLPAAASLINFVVLTSAASSANSGVFSTSRMLFGLAQEGVAPSAFAKLSKRAVPAKGLTFSCICLLGGVVMLYVNPSVIGAFTMITTVSAILFMFVWTIILCSYLVYRKQRPHLHEKSIYKMPLGKLMCWVCMAFFVFVLVLLTLEEDTRQALIVTPLWFIALGLGWVFIGKKRMAGVR